MKLLFVAVVALVSTAAMAQRNDPCKLVSDEKGVRVWQCAPTPVPNTGAAGGQLPNTAPLDHKN
jgi:hypothetical protein